MAGPNLELFKFGLYLFFPLAVMVHYGDPQWYHQNVLPIRDQFWPKEETLYRPPRTSTDLKASLKEMREQRLAKKQENSINSSSSTSSINSSESIPNLQQIKSKLLTSSKSDESSMDTQRLTNLNRFKLVDKARLV